MDDPHARRAGDGCRGMRRSRRSRRPSTSHSRAAMTSQPVTEDAPGAGPRRLRAGWTGWWPTSASTALAYYYRGLNGNANEIPGASVIVGNPLLTAQGGARLGRGRPEELHRDAHHGPARRGRLVHRVLRDGLQRRLHPHGPRRTGPRCDCGGQARAARVGAVPRQAGFGISVEFNGAQWPHHDPRADADRCRVGSSCWPQRARYPRPAHGDRQHQLALKFALDPAEFMNRWSEQGQPTTARRGQPPHPHHPQARAVARIGVCGNRWMNRTLIRLIY